MNHPILQRVTDALERGQALTIDQVLELREKSENAIRRAKWSFWGAILLINVLIWAPKPEGISPTAVGVVVVLCMIFALLYPILAIRRHQRHLFFLKESHPGPKKRRTGEEGRAYIDQVKAEGRPFIVAEVQVIEGRDLGETARS